MTPILGIMASAISGNLWSPGKDFDSIATVNSGGGSATFTSIPATYKHLQIRVLLRDGTSGASTCYLRINSDSGSNYNAHYLQGDGSNASAGSAATTYMGLSSITNSTSLANNFGVLVIDLLDYANTNKFKTVRALGGYDDNGSGIVSLNSGLWRNTAAITTIQVASLNSNAATNSTVALYGIK